MSVYNVSLFGHLRLADMQLYQSNERVGAYYMDGGRARWMGGVGLYNKD